MPVPTIPTGPRGNVVERLPLVKAIEDHLAASLPTTAPATNVYVTKPVKVPHLDGDGHVQKHVVLHPFAGDPAVELALSPVHVELDWTFQATCVAMAGRDCLALVEDVDAALYLWTPAVAGYEIGPLRPPAGYEPGNPREDSTVQPPRFFVPLQYRTTVTRTSA